MQTSKNWLSRLKLSRRNCKSSATNSTTTSKGCRLRSKIWLNSYERRTGSWTWRIRPWSRWLRSRWRWMSRCRSWHTWSKPSKTQGLRLRTRKDSCFKLSKKRKTYSGSYAKPMSCLKLRPKTSLTLRKETMNSWPGSRKWSQNLTLLRPMSARSEPGTRSTSQLKATTSTSTSLSTSTTTQRGANSESCSSGSPPASTSLEPGRFVSK